MSKKMITLLVCLVMAVSLFTACSGGTQPEQLSAEPSVQPSAEADTAGSEEASTEPAPEESVVVGVSLLTRTHVFYNSIEAALVAEAKVLGFELDIQDANSDAATQLAQVQDFITKGVDAIILCPTSSSGITSALGLCAEAKIPVFTMDIAAEEGEVVCHVGTDNYAGGELAGKYTAENILENQTGKVAIVTYSEVESCVNREKGFVEAVKAYPGVEVVDIQNCSGDSEKAASVTQDMLLKHSDLVAIFAVGDPFAVGALSAIKAANREVKVIGFDGNPEGVQEIMKGELWVADIAQDPTAIGTTTLDKVKAYLDGETVDPLILISPQVIDVTNAADFAS